MTDPAVDSSSAPSVATVLFADVAGSTRLYETLGDDRAHEAVGGCLAALGAIARRFDGRIIKTLGDEIMVAFALPEAALRAVTDMQIEQRRRNESGGDRLEVRAGFHHGEVLLRDGDLYGDTVNVAARVAGLAKAGQILTTGRTVECLPAYARGAVRMLDALPVKGKQEALAVCEIIWQWDDSLTMMDAREAAAAETPPTMILDFLHGSVRMEGNLSAVTLGRDPSAQIVLAHRKVSRSHARIERRRDKFVISDTSTNGTFVRFTGDQELMLRREELALRGSGHISCGASIDSADAEWILFRIE